MIFISWEGDVSTNITACGDRRGLKIFQIGLTFLYPEDLKTVSELIKQAAETQISQHHYFKN